MKRKNKKNRIKKSKNKRVQVNKENIVKEKKGLGSEQIIPLGFLAVILIGALILMLPIASVKEGGASFLEALFTSTTSVCVTGAVVVPTYSYWTLFGKIIILILIQIGGFGIIAVTSLVTMMIHKSMSLKNQILLKDSLNLDSFNGVTLFLGRVLVGTFFVEGFGALGYSFVFIPEYGFWKGAWYSIFHAVSAFCNAGIDLIGDDSLVKYQSNPIIIMVTILMIVLGGIGFVVWFDLASIIKNYFTKSYKREYKKKRISEHAKLALSMTTILVFVGAISIFVLEYNNPQTFGNMNIFEKIINSIFQSVTFRTAGFSTVPQENLNQASTLVGDVLMFIGGSPIGTAGGVKTITFCVLILNTIAFITGKDEVRIFNRRVSEELIQKSTAIVTVNFTIIIVFSVLMMAISNVSLTDALYEINSATSTVGLSRGITSNLNVGGQIIEIIAMYLGRIGPISMALFFKSRYGSPDKVKHASGRFIVG